MKINKFAKVAIALVTIISMGGGYNLNEVYASESTSTISIEDPAGLLRQYSGLGTYRNGDKYNIKAKPVDANNFTGWLLKSGSSYTDVTGVSDKTDFSFVADSNKTYVPNRNYSITYNLNGGTVGTANPTTYSLKDAFTLNNPTRHCYNFTGWTGTGLSSASAVVAVPQCSWGNRSYVANWAENPIKATINVNDNSFRATRGRLVVIMKPDGTLRDEYTYSGLGYSSSVQGTVNVMPGDKIIIEALYPIQGSSVKYNSESNSYSGGYIVPSAASSISILIYFHEGSTSYYETFGIYVTGS